MMIRYLLLWNFLWAFLSAMAEEAPANAPVVLTIHNELIQQYKQAFRLFLQFDDGLDFSDDDFLENDQCWILHQFETINGRALLDQANRGSVRNEISYDIRLATTLFILYRLLSNQENKESWCSIGSYLLFRMLYTFYGLPLKIDGVADSGGITLNDLNLMRQYEAQQKKACKDLCLLYMRYNRIMIAKLTELFPFSVREMKADEHPSRTIRSTKFVEKKLAMCDRWCTSFGFKPAIDPYRLAFDSDMSTPCP